MFVTSHCWKVYCISFTQPIYQEENFFKSFSLNSYNCNYRSIQYTLDSLFLLVFYGCYDKLMQTWWLNTTEIHHLTFLEVRNQKQVSPRSNQSVSRTAFIYEGSRIIICFFFSFAFFLFSCFFRSSHAMAHGPLSSSNQECSLGAHITSCPITPILLHYHVFSNMGSPASAVII